MTIARVTIAVFVLATFTAPLGGCVSWWQRNFASRELITEGLSEPAASLSFTFPYAWYDNEPAQTSLYLSNLSPEELAAGGELTGQIAHIQMMWLPRPGWTPARKGCTNVVIRLLVLSKGEVGLYGGGGFAWPWDEPGDKTFGMQVLASSLSLLEKTEGFVDLLSPAEMTGIADAPLDTTATQRMRLVTSQFVTNSFKDIRWVRAWEGNSAQTADAVTQPPHDSPSPVIAVDAMVARGEVHPSVPQLASAAASAGSSASR